MNDAELLQALRAGKPAAKDELAERYERRLYATACHVLGYRDQEVEDVVQDTFVAALKSLERFEERSGLYTWLNHICVNQCFERLRQRRRQLATEQAGLEALLAPLGERADADAQAAAEKAERLARLQPLIVGLGEPCAGILRWRYEEGLALNEIKERLRAPLGTVAARIHRCLNALRRQAAGSLS